MPIEFKIDDGVAIITINRPEARNAIDRESALAVEAAGTVLAPLNWRLAAEKFDFIVGDSTMSVLLSDEELARPAANLRRFRKVKKANENCEDCLQ